LPSRLQMKLHHEISASFEPPRHAFGCQRRNFPWCPSQRVSIRVVRGKRDHSFISRLRIGLVKAARRWCGVDENISVMNSAIARTKLDAAHVTSADARNRNDEVPEEVGTIRPQRIFWQCDDQIRFPKLPTRDPPRLGREV